MSTATASASATRSSPAGRNYLLLRRLHSLTGILFGGYLVVHLLVNAALVEGARHGSPKTVYQMQVDKIHSLPLLLAIEWAFIYLPILYHTFYGMWIMITGQPNLNYHYGKNYAYVAQRASAIILVFFILFHVLSMKGLFGPRFEFDPLKATETTVTHFHASWWIGHILYPIGILAGTFHLANGFWTAGITWGLTVSAEAQKRWGMACVGLFLLTSGCGLAALISALLSEPVVSNVLNVGG